MIDREPHRTSAPSATTRRSTLIPATLLAACGVVFALPAASQQPDVILRLNAKHLTPEVTKYIAEVGVKQPVTADAGDTLGKLIERHCGRRDANYLKYLETRRGDYPAIKGDFAFDAKVESKLTLDLPYCLRIPEDEEATKAWRYATWANLKSIKKRTVPGTDITDWSSLQNAYSPEMIVMTPFWAAPNAAIASADPKSTVPDWASPPNTNLPEMMVMNPYGKAYNVPIASIGKRVAPSTLRVYEGWTPISLSQDFNPSDVSAKLTGMLSSDGDGRKPEIGTPRPDIELLSTVPTQEDKCPKSMRGISEYPVDAAALMYVLGLNMDRKAGTWFRSAEIVIADSGLLAGASSFLERAKALASLPTPEDYEYLTPTPEYPSAQHGTYVASAALGGAYFRRFMALLRFPILIRPVNIIADKNGRIDELKLKHVIDSGKSETLVINMSIASQGEIKGLDRILDARRNALFVVAAGNAPKKIAGTHPAHLGGDFPNLLVVAGLDPEGGFSPHSSWSPSQVEIAAFGCRVPVHGVDAQAGGTLSKVEEMSGTSMASPLVAFAAALLLNHSIISPPEIRKRIFASADFDPALDGKVKNNLKLNTVRAVSVYHDVITKASSAQVGAITGHIVGGGDRLLPLCKGADSRGRRLEHGGLRSLTVYRKGEEQRIFYMFEYDKEKPLDVRDCNLDQALAAHKLTIKEAVSGKEETVSVGELRNLTFAYFQR